MVGNPNMSLVFSLALTSSAEQHRLSKPVRKCSIEQMTSFALAMKKWRYRLKIASHDRKAFYLFLFLFFSGLTAVAIIISGGLDPFVNVDSAFLTLTPIWRPYLPLRPLPSSSLTH